MQELIHCASCLEQLILTREAWYKEWLISKNDRLQERLLETADIQKILEIFLSKTMFQDQRHCIVLSSGTIYFLDNDNSIRRFQNQNLVREECITNIKN